MTIDMNEQHRRNPTEYHQRLATSAGGRMLDLKRRLGDARNSVDRDRLEEDLSQARADLSYHKRRAAEIAEGESE